LSDEERVEPPERKSTVSDDAQDGASAPGVPFAYEVTNDEIARQEAAIREVNSRLGFLLAAALTFGTFYFKEVTEPWRQVVFGVALIVVLVLVLLGYIPRTHLRAPNPHGVTEAANERPGRIKELALGTMLQAFDVNAKVITVKNFYYALALVFGVLAVIVGVGVETTGAVIHWWQDTHGTAAVKQSNKRATSGHVAKNRHVSAHGGGETVSRARNVIPTRHP
jgi:hypothetical protein